MKNFSIREQWAIKIILLTAVLFTSLSALYAWIQNPGNENNNKIHGGILIFKKHGCVQCHSISGIGNPRLPLDGIGSRMTNKEIQAWIIAGPTTRKNLSKTKIKIKSSYKNMPRQEMNLLLDLLKNSK